MDRAAIAREERRRQVTEELTFERERADALREQLNMLAVELEGAGVDEQVFARMEPGDVELIRDALQPAGEGEEDDGEDWDAGGDNAEEVILEDSGDGPDENEQEAEIARLQEELAASERRQQALERYLEALGTLDAG